VRSRAQVVSVIFKIISMRVVRRALASSVVINYQITRKTHQPVLQVALFRVVLLQRTIDAYENFLRQILRRVCARGKAIGQIVYTARVGLYNLLPRRAIARATPSD